MSLKIKILLIIICIFSISGCGEQKYIDLCHLKIQQGASHTAEIISTEVNKSGLDIHSIYGKAKLQNGFGAWSNYSYMCGFTGETITSFKLNEGW
jgi:hypothetical protein